MLYDRKIKYLDYYEGGAKVNGGGFVKLEVRGNTLRFELTIRGLHPTDSFERDIVLQGAEKEATLGQVRIQNGCGQFRYTCDVDHAIGTTGISYSELRGIRISIGGTREILCQCDNSSNKRRITPSEEDTQKTKSGLQEPKSESAAESYTDNEVDSEAPVYTENEQPRELNLEKPEKAEEKRKETTKEECESTEAKDRESDNRENNNREEKNGEDKDRQRQEDKEDTKKDIEKKESKERGKDGLEIKGAKEPLQTILQPEEQSGDWAKDKSAMTENNRAEQPEVKIAPAKLMEDKWQQLSAIYPHIQPFRDERDYLSLTPSDFVLFPDRFYRAVNNSFLLHGYYNYHHLILARIERRGEIIYYIGVPGNYFEREKQVAIMFGFESFECEAETAKTGDFGYYMMRTEL